MKKFQVRLTRFFLSNSWEWIANLAKLFLIIFLHFWCTFPIDFAPNGIIPWCQINRKSVITIEILFNSARHRSRYSFKCSFLSFFFKFNSFFFHFNSFFFSIHESGLWIWKLDCDLPRCQSHWNIICCRRPWSRDLHASRHNGGHSPPGIPCCSDVATCRITEAVELHEFLNFSLDKIWFLFAFDLF